jgi:hypothetical protein
MRSGPGWDRFPDIKKELNPSIARGITGFARLPKKSYFVTFHQFMFVHST